ncbi:hypothetical protein CTEN210_12241 [Chaetoceros tenuissimus]|uniref:G-patch domain-containing protein n=1 Tax=Chaetoceros tenuissimus TaxID=426638 RepID=A0AAD3D395_9STRA|nr:hypothetical protein CTEN210_12241 [Chaetoceros tenuissimus]
MDDEYDDEFTYAGIGMKHHLHVNNMNNSSSEEEESSDDEYDPKFKSTSRKDEAIYGIFQNDDEQPVKKRKVIPWKKQKGLENMFVKSTTKEKKEDTETGKNVPEVKAQETEEDEQVKQMQQEANEKFYALLKRGTEKKKTTTSSLLNRLKADMKNKKVEEKDELINSMPTIGGGGLGFKASTANEATTTTLNNEQDGPSLSSFIGSSSQMANFIGASSKSIQTSSKPVKKDPNLGTWEKHTKGIGMKLLSKMGYKGSGGLGAKRVKKVETTDPNEGTTKQELKVEERTGISRPVEVVVRPAKLGLGFGNFQEATKLKTNRRIEAEVRGIDWKKKEEEELKQKQLEEEKKMQKELGIRSSALPTTDALLQGRNWQKGRKRARKEKKDVKIVTYQEVLGKNESKNELVVDMRGPSAASAISDSKENEDPSAHLGEELLHNLTFLLNSYENKLHATSHFVKSSRSKADSLQSEVENTERMIAEMSEKKKKLRQVNSLIEDLETYQNQATFDIYESNEVSKVEQILDSLSVLFTPEERKSLQYFSVLLPSLLGPLVDQALNNWSPLSLPADQNRSLLSSIFNLCFKSVKDGDADSQESCLEIIFMSHMYPILKRTLQSSKWDPTMNIDNAIDLFESLLHVAKLLHIENDKSTNEVEETTLFGAQILTDRRNSMVALVKDAIMFDIIYPKLCRALSSYKGNSSANTIDKWIIPWLPHLDYRSMLEKMLPDIKRKIRTEIMTAAKSTVHRDDALFLQHSLNIVLKPWVNILSTQSLYSITSECVAPRLGRYLAKVEFSTDLKTNELECLDILYEYYTEKLISDSLLLSLLEGEILYRLASCLYENLKTRTLSSLEAAKLYCKWKKCILRNKKDHKTLIIQCLDDDQVCRIFYGMLLMISKATKDVSNLEDLQPPSPTTINYKTVQARRAKEERLTEEENLLKGTFKTSEGSTRKHTLPRQSGTATFRDVVEDFANHNNVSFYPKIGPNNTKEGKTIFLFGNAQIYLENNVAFYLDSEKDEWIPTALNSLLQFSEN